MHIRYMCLSYGIGFLLANRHAIGLQLTKKQTKRKNE